MEIKAIADAISAWIGKQVIETGTDGVVIGLSGGIDSTVVAILASKVTWTVGARLPCGSDPADAADAETASAACGDSCQLDMTATHGVMKQLMGFYIGDEAGESQLPSANLKSRLRMAALYYLANTYNLLVCGTTNKSELLTGYCTKYGDGGVDIEPIADVWKTDVCCLAEYLGVPQNIIDKPPTAGLWEGQTDEAELGMPYEELDAHLAVLHALAEMGNDLKLARSYAATEEERRNFEKAKELYMNSQHKRKLPPCCMLEEEDA